MAKAQCLAVGCTKSAKAKGRCKAHYSRQWFLRNGRDSYRYPIYKREYNRKQTRILRTFVDSVKSQPCADCGVQYPPCAMQFDHVRGTKKYTITDMTARVRNLDRIIKEMAKCEIVCANCHSIRTHIYENWRHRG